MQSLVIFFYVVALGFLAELYRIYRYNKYTELEVIRLGFIGVMMPMRKYRGASRVKVKIDTRPNKVQRAGSKLMPLVEACNDIEETAKKLAVKR